jgi:hypothetical protein
MILGITTDIPVHRLAIKGDTTSKGQHAIIKKVNRIKRTEEGFFKNPRWVEV